MKRNQKGGALIIVLFALTILLVGAASLARVTQTATSLSGNIASKDASRQAAEVGVNTAFAALVELSDLNADTDGWYFAQDVVGDEPTAAMWDAAPVLDVGQYEVRYVVERLCAGALPVTDPLQQCMVRKVAEEGSAKAGVEAIESPAALQYRISTQVSGGKGTSTVIQVMAHR